MLDILERLVAWIGEHSTEEIVVAYSGGRDSHVLLHALWKLSAKLPFHLSAIHVNHDLQKESANWSLHCQQICQLYQVPLQIVNLKLTILPGESLESVARIKRYQAFASLLCENAILLTAHTQSDQAETFLLQMLRGSGLQGLGAIAPLRALGKAKLARPLLEVNREEIALYAKKEQLTWIEDNSNQDMRYRRNYLRNNVLPQLKTLSEGVEDCIARAAQHCQNAQSLLDEYIHLDVQACLGENLHTLKVEPFLAHSSLRQQYIFRHWLKLNGTLMPSLRKCQDILAQVNLARVDSQPCVSFGSWQIRRFQGNLYLLNKKETQRNLQPINWQLHHPLQLNDGSIWQAKIAKGQGICVKKLTNEMLQIVFRKGGERCHVAGKKQSRPLKKILQDFNIPSWERASLPLFYQAGELVGVGTLFVSHAFAVDSPLDDGWVIQKVCQLNK